ncbi:MAG: hypothetical protein HFJ17_05940 [Clostridia bacterium]|nr:hypothetical protein [Clostridia bacterium]
MNKKEKKIILRLIMILILIDQVIKIIMINANSEIRLLLSKDQSNMSHIVISIIVIIVMIRYILNNNTYIKMNSRIIISFAIAGAISNVIDRIWIGNVINYINISKFMPINLSYIYIVITWIGMAIILTKYSIKEMKRKERNKLKNGNKGRTK